MGRKPKKRKWIFLWIGIALLLLLLICDMRLKTVFYIVETDKISGPVRIALLTDLHSCRYGKNQENLVEEVKKQYQNYDFDLVLSGHAHGGQWRIPGLLNGLFAPNQGLFPKYVGGRYDYENGTMIVSRGLARESTPVPRIINRPELVIIDIKGNMGESKE